jgi:transposase
VRWAWAVLKACRCAPALASLRCARPVPGADFELAGGGRPGQIGGMSNESELQQHYRLLLGIQLPWQIKSVNLDVNGKRVEIGLEWSAGQKAACPVCGQACGLYDQAGERTWRHLDTMQFQTIIRARVPRIECPTDGVKTIVVPWAEPHGRFSRLFERFAIDVLLCARSLTQAATLLDLSWDEVEHILRRGVKRGLLRRELDGVRYVGIDEKSFGAGQSYISLLTDLEGRRVLEVVADRTQAAAESLWSTLSQPQRTQVEAVAAELSAADHVGILCDAVPATAQAVFAQLV